MGGHSVPGDWSHGSCSNEIEELTKMEDAKLINAYYSS